MSNISRKDFLKGAALCSMGLAATSFLGGTAYAESVESSAYQGGSNMKITKVTPIPCASRWMLVKVETDAGITGWGVRRLGLADRFRRGREYPRFPHYW